jgi:hypothetical protein
VHYQIDNSDLAMMLECLKEDERRNRLMGQAGYSTSDDYVTDRLETLVLNKIGLDADKEHTLPCGNQHDEREIAARFLQKQYYHGDAWENAMVCIGKLYALKEDLGSLDYTKLNMKEDIYG